MPFGDHATILSGFITDTNGNTICNFTDVETFSDEEIIRGPEHTFVDLSNIEAPITINVKSIWTSSSRKLYRYLMGWKAKGPYRGRLLRKLIAWRYVK